MVGHRNVFESSRRVVMSRVQSAPRPLGRRVFAVLGSLGIAAGLFVADAAVAPTAAIASEYCSSPDDAAMPVQNHNRFSRVRSKACLEFTGGQVIVKGVGQTDKPSGCRADFPVECDATVGAGRAEYHWVEITVKANGRLYNPCRWDDEGAHDRTWTCSTPPIPNPGGTQEFVAEAQTCVDMKDDGKPAKCTAWAELRHAG
ncbi:MAG: hypothetical protein ACRDKW_03050 [Actinomycetota bacterium]